MNLPELLKIAEAATKGKWEVQTGCSWRRIGTPGNDGDVLMPVTHHMDGHPDLASSSQNLDFIAAFNPSVAIELIKRLQEAEKDAARWRHIRPGWSNPDEVEANCDKEIAAMNGGK